MIRAITSKTSGRLLAGQPLDGLEPQLVTFALTPYIGSAEAERIAAEPQELPASLAEAAAQS